MVRKVLSIAIVAMAFVVLGASPAHAWYVKGYVYCDSNGSGGGDSGDLPLPNIAVTVTGNGFSAVATTDGTGAYLVNLPDMPGSYTATAAAPGGATALAPTTNPASFSLTASAMTAEVHFLFDSRACATTQTAACWLTGGGAKFSSVTGTLLAEKGPQHSFGGNVNPGCNTDSGEGGQWNHVAHALKLHFQGLQVRVVRCGNVPGIPPGSESPETPYNFIEFEGSGTLKGIKGNNADYSPVTFFARAEDRNEPGSSGAKDGALIDRYFIRVTDSSGVVRLLVDLDGDPNTVDPVKITDGNLQIHISSCSVGG
jgi:hypothetical protein